ncbi:39S ribosomal protein L44, mitochondrial [Chrysoperla carnea]|uniref:39S ribosomal protein L44, mitochondrial n=1 Tax=Chrysoperla carnea TaxID=189513 RepID=UPI001D098E22|nr:39S ribosomal protein L44, mitochondrial [Chrysoperla carnea]
MFSTKFLPNTLKGFRSLQPFLIQTNAQRSYKRWFAPTLMEIKRRKDNLGPQPPSKRSSFIEWNYNAELFAFGKRLNENFDENLLKNAFVNRSFILQEEVRQREAGVDNPEVNLIDNRKLIENGENFISKIVKKFLVDNLPQFPEEGRNAVHDYLLSETVLSNISFHIGTKDIILSAEFPPNESTLADTLKAVIGALLQSSGEERAENFVKDFILTQLNGKDVNDIWRVDDPMGILQKLLAEQNRGEPEPRLLNEAGKNTILACFEVGIYSDKQLIASGFGESIQIAIEVAARQSLKKIFKTEDNLAPFSYNTPQSSISLNP